MIKGRGNSLGAGAALAMVTMLAPAPGAAAPVQLSVDTDVRIGYDMNPFLAGGSDVSSGYAQVAVQPTLTKRTEKGDVTLSGYLDATRYQKHYDQSNQYGAELGVHQRLTPKLTVFGALRYDSEVVGQGRYGDNVTGPPVDDTDVNLIGLRSRSETYQASFGYSYQISTTDSISADGGYTDTRYTSGPGADSRNVGGRISWQHALSERTKVGVSGSAYRIDYDTPGLLTWIYQPSVTFSTQLSATWKVDASLGVAFSKLYLPAPLGDKSSKGISGNLNLCHTGLKSDFCLSAARSVTGSGFGGSVVRSQIGFNYNRRLTEVLSWAGSATYSRSKSQSGLVDTREYVAARGGLNWKVKPWLSFGAEAKYRDIYGTGRQIRADYGGDLSASILFPGKK